MSKTIVIFSDNDTWEILNDEISVVTLADEDYERLLDGEVSAGELAQDCLSVHKISRNQNNELVINAQNCGLHSE